MRLDQLKPAPGSTKQRKRVGRGGIHGTYSGRGSGGQKSRAGYSMRPGFEGGQLPLIQRLPRKRGFTNIFRVEYNVVNLEKLNTLEAGSEVTPETMVSAGLIKSTKLPVKVLGGGEINKALSVKANRFSATAKAKIEAAGGSTEEVEYAPKTDAKPA